MKTDDSYRDRLEDLLAGLPVPDPGPRHAHEPDPPPADPPPPGPPRPARVFGAPHLSALGVVLVLVLAVVAVVLMRSRATTVPIAASVQPAATPTMPSPGPVSLTPAAVPTTSATTPAAAIRVHVAGRVGRPGVYPLAAGARVIDAVAAAGGMAAGAHPGGLNLAAPVCDGCQVLIPGSGDGRLIRPDVTTGTPASGTGGAGGDARIDLNAASAEELQSLDGVGPATAAKIIAWRQSHGRFSDVAELQEIDGIGPKTYARLKDHVRV